MPDTVPRKLTLDDAADGLKQYVDLMTEGKVLIMPHKHCRVSL